MSFWIGLTILKKPVEGSRHLQKINDKICPIVSVQSYTCALNNMKMDTMVAEISWSSQCEFLGTSSSGSNEFKLSGYHHSKNDK